MSSLVKTDGLSLVLLLINWNQKENNYAPYDDRHTDVVAPDVDGDVPDCNQLDTPRLTHR